MFCFVFKIWSLLQRSRSLCETQTKQNYRNNWENEKTKCSDSQRWRWLVIFTVMYDWASEDSPVQLHHHIQSQSKVWSSLLQLDCQFWPQINTIIINTNTWTGLKISTEAWILANWPRSLKYDSLLPVWRENRFCFHICPFHMKLKCLNVKHDWLNWLVIITHGTTSHTAFS